MTRCDTATTAVSTGGGSWESGGGGTELGGCTKTSMDKSLENIQVKSHDRRLSLCVNL